jgi:hypothetical protein
LLLLLLMLLLLPHSFRLKPPSSKKTQIGNQRLYNACMGMRRICEREKGFTHVLASEAAASSIMSDTSW